MTTSAQGGVGKAQKEEEEIHLQAELSSLGIDCKRKNELNDKEELKGLIANSNFIVYCNL